MMRSMYAAVAGLRTHQTRMDVIGDNIANVNTPGFKRGRATFQDIFYQTLKGGTAGGADRGGTNPQQIGLGTALATIDIIHTQGAAQPTGKADDLMIQGEGFFVLKEDPADAGAYFSRAGAFRFVPADDGNNYLVNPSNGLNVMSTDGDRIAIPGDARSFSIDTMGNVTYIDNTGASQSAATIAIAKFPNPSGLIKVGENMYRYDFAAGDEPGGANDAGGFAGVDGRGTIIPSALEMSNVELAQEFTEMIVTQRGFQANARTITTSDEMLQELANLKR